MQSKPLVKILKIKISCKESDAKKVFCVAKAKERNRYSITMPACAIR
jgi:hypothetical protein